MSGRYERDDDRYERDYMERDERGGQERDYGYPYGRSSRSGYGGYGSNRGDEEYGSSDSQERSHYGSGRRQHGRDYDQDDRRNFGYGQGETNYSRGYGARRGWDDDDAGFGTHDNRYYRSGFGEYPGRSYGRNYSRGYNTNGRGYGEGRGEDRGWWDRASDEVASWFGNEEAERRRRMDEMREKNYYGRGPRNYRRSDDRIKEDINDRLTDDPYIDASDIEVSVDDREVTLTGTVDSRLAKRRAEDLTEMISGVINVENRLRVNRNNMTGTMASETTDKEASTGRAAKAAAS